MSGGGTNPTALDTGKADRAVWLMKCPPVLSRSWKNLADEAASSPDPCTISNPLVAKVVVSVDPLLPSDDPSSLKFKLEVAHSGTGNNPKSYSLNIFKDFVPMGVFSESNQGRLAMEGKVEHKFDMEPHNENFGRYGKLCRERTNKAMTKTRQVQVIDNDHGVLMRPMPGVLGLVPSGAKEKKKLLPTKGPEMKRTRRERSEMENILFKLFERQPNWALKQLVQETNQPEQFVKELLNDLCVYNKRGPNQGTHELKPEYKKATEETNAS